MNSFKLTAAAYRLIIHNWKVIGGIMLIYAVFNIVLVHGLNGGLDVTSLKSSGDKIFHGVTGHLATGFTLYALLLTSHKNVASASASSYQSFLLIIISLALVWSYRQILAGQAIRIRDGFYQGMQPLVPIMLVMAVVGLQLLPMLAGLWLYITLILTGIATNIVEQAGTILISLALVSLSVYWLCSSLFALYVAALPGIAPLKALRSSRELVRYRRWSLIRKLLFLPLVMLVVGSAIMLPIILVVPIIAQWVFFALATVSLAAIHAYMYTLYRELIRE